MSSFTVAEFAALTAPYMTARSEVSRRFESKFVGRGSSQLSQTPRNARLVIARLARCPRPLSFLCLNLVLQITIVTALPLVRDENRAAFEAAMGRNITTWHRQRQADAPYYCPVCLSIQWLCEFLW